MELIRLILVYLPAAPETYCKVLQHFIAVDSKFGATISNVATIYHLRAGSILATSAGTSAQTVNANVTSSTYSSLGT